MSVLRFFRLSGHLEAYSYLILLLIAMPLKYIWKEPMYVRWVGSAHGALFVTFCVAIVLAAYKNRWSMKMTLLAFVSSFFPLGPFIFERRYLPKESKGADQ